MGLPQLDFRVPEATWFKSALSSRFGRMPGLSATGALAWPYKIAVVAVMALVAGGTLVTVTGPAEATPVDGRAVDFVVEADRAQLSEIAQRARGGRLRANIGCVATLDDAVAALNPAARRTGKTIIQVRP